MGQDHTASRRASQDGSTVVRHSFVVRLWREAGQYAWLGSVQHVGSGAEICVANLDELLTFIERRIDRPPPASEAVHCKPEPPAARLK